VFTVLFIRFIESRAPLCARDPDWVSALSDWAHDPQLAGLLRSRRMNFVDAHVAEGSSGGFCVVAGRSTP
jgi:hypothetical protein